jgi:hypothetical protein
MSFITSLPVLFPEPDPDPDPEVEGNMEVGTSSCFEDILIGLIGLNEKEDQKKINTST